MHLVSMVVSAVPAKDVHIIMQWEGDLQITEADTTNSGFIMMLTFL